MTEEKITGELMTPAEVAALFRVDPKTVARWANSKKIPSIRTLGGHRRFRREDIEAILNGNTENIN
ncbi:BldC family transcriptional regulator [Arcanobacterium bovis]|uniref:BldC family transcriptional regulator n=1 Tax=Arcanobacterium bovis TaxID=2529275 RepID=A0A4Q9UZK4_9ACTO|nr:BldC family transcriptional regulator [Arcanobacterium bovis]TBW21444.1 BldC family transcriptional regulator [Arcanobacterium bovis]